MAVRGAFNPVHFLSPLKGRPEVAVMLLFVSLVMSGNGLVAPILSVYGATFAASSTLVGMVITLFGVGRILINLPAGVLSLRFGARRVLLAGPLILVIGSVGAATTDSFTWLLIWRFVQGIGSGIYMTVSTAMIAGMAGPTERGRVMALHQAGLLLGAGIGPMLGGFLAAHFGYTAPFWAYALVSLLALVFAYFSVEEAPYPSGDAEGEDGRIPARAFLFQPAFLAICAVNFGVFFTRTAAQWLAIPLLASETYGLDIAVIGLALGLIAISNFLMLPLAGGVIDEFGPRRTTILASICCAAGLALAGIVPTLWAFWAGIVLLGIGSGFLGPAISAQAAEAIPRRLYGPAIGLLRTAGDIGFVLGPVLIGLLGDLAGLSHAGAIIVNAVLVLTALLLFWILVPKEAGSI